MTSNEPHQQAHDGRSGIELSKKELYFLAGIIGSDRLLGVEDPFRGYLTEEITEEWNKVKASLLRKGYLTEAPGGVELGIPSHVYSTVAVTGLANRSCWVRFLDTVAEPGRKEYEGYFHFTDDLTIERVQAQGQADMYYFLEYGSTNEACSVIVNRMHWAEQDESDITAVMLSKRHFHKLYEQANELTVEQMVSQLMTFDGEEEGAVALAHSLKHRTASGEMLFLVWNEKTWDVQGAAFLVGGARNWLIRQSSKGDEDWLTATLTTKEQLESMLINWNRQHSMEEGR
ncbi:hypothetical protein [Paenibacillus alvei]|uniref:hypothetical protein n=1 Tax=Paenibacillus alvei TaxID=44250 RepID=UPI0013DCFA86|nr:hypothetical protein [Paenibacillus alvei]NEZ41717.1 hypothetical protein [Paenibacillus alvei]